MLLFARFIIILFVKIQKQIQVRKKIFKMVFINVYESNQNFQY